MDKQITSSTADLEAGDKITYQITVSHLATSADAFDIELTDSMPSGLKIDPASVSVVGTSATYQVSGDQTSLILGVNGDFDLPDADIVTITYDAILQSDVQPAQTFINDAQIKWTSLDGEVAGERDGSGGINDYSDTDTVTTNVRPYIEIEKIIANFRNR